MCMADMHEYGDELGDLDVIVYSVTLRVTYSPSFSVFFKLLFGIQIAPQQQITSRYTVQYSKALCSVCFCLCSPLRESPL